MVLKKAFFPVPFHSIYTAMVGQNNAMQYLQHYFTMYFFLNGTLSTLLFTK